MTSRCLLLSGASALVLALSLPATAQPTQPRPAPAAPVISGREILLDRVIAVVNDEAITQHELNEQRRAVMLQLRDAKVQPPSPDVLDRQLVERMITERALMQHARETGIRVDDVAVERTIQRIAQDNKMSLDAFRSALERESIPYPKYREDVRRELTVGRLREREVGNKIVVSDAEVDAFLATAAAREGDAEYLLSHILVAVPEQASPEQVDQRRKRAEEAVQQLQSGSDFAQVAAATSDAPDALTGGSLGWRSAARLPTVFADVVRTMQVGQVSGVLRSPAGFHIVRLADRRSRNQPTVVEQTRARHILVRVNETTSENDGRTRIERIKDRLDSGAKFEDMARINSEDPSSAKGGDLGWISPGDTVPDFEQAMAKLAPGETSAPVRTPFGWHLIRVEERRKQDVTEDRKREQARQAIRQRKADEVFADFVRQMRDRAYVEYKVDDR